MASVYKRAGSRFWMARFKAPGGNTWLSRSTKTANEAEARRLAFLWEGAGATLAVETPSGAQLDKVVRSLWERFSGKRLELTPTKDFFENWVKRMEATRAAKTSQRYRQVAEDFVEHLGDRAKYDLRAITAADVQGYIDKEARAGKRGSTITIAAKILRSAFNTAIRGGAVEKNPAGLLELPDATQEEREPFTESDLEALLLAAAGTEWETAILLGAYAGMRLGDATTLRWDSVDLAGQSLVFTPQKTARKKKRLRVPLVPRLAEHLEILAGREAAQTAAFVLPGLALCQVSGRAGLSRKFKELMGKANVDAVAIEDGGKAVRKLSRKSFHSLRHSCASFLVNAHVAEDVRRKVLGHADAKTTARYSHLEAETIRTAMAKMPGAKGVKK